MCEFSATGGHMLPLVSADIPDIVIRGGTLMLEDGVSVHVQQREFVSACSHINSQSPSWHR